MDWLTVVITAILGTSLQTVVIVALYNHYIIPRIVSKVRDDLMAAIDNWVADMKGSLAETIKTEIKSLKLSVAGKVGKNTQLLNAAQSYLETELGADLGEDLDQDVYQNIVQSAIAQYGGPLVDAAIKALTQKKEATIQGW